MARNNTSYIPGAAAMVFFAAAILLLPWLGETLFYSKGEPREAIVATAILDSGNWILPTYFGDEIPFKPPFLGWLIAIFATIFNGGVVNEYISRLPSALAAIAMIMCGYRWAAARRGPRFAMVMSIITLTSFEVFRAALACRLDMVLTAAMVIAIYMMYKLTEDERPQRQVLRYIAVILLLACAALTKGPIGALLPCFVIGVYRLLRRRRFWPSLLAMLGIACAAMIPLALWFYAAYRQGGDSFAALMYEENLGRLFGSMSYESHEHTMWYNFFTLATGLLPWTLMALFMVGGLRRYRRAPLSTEALLSLTAVVLIVGFYCIPASKRSVYLLPAYPFLCYGLACIAEFRPAQAGLKVFSWFMAILAILAPAAIAVLYLHPVKGIVLDHISVFGWLLLLVPVASGIAWIMNRHSPLAHTLACVWALFFAYAAVGMPAVLNPRSDKHLAVEAQRIAAAQPGAQRAAVHTDSAKIGAGTSAAADIYFVNPWEHLRPYCANFYLRDHLHLLTTLADAETLPAGTVVLVPQQVDTTGHAASFTFLPGTDRSCDTRRPVAIAIKRSGSH